jgi:signal transduction histidine kinase
MNASELNSVWEYLRRLPDLHPSPSPTEVLSEVARFFDATAIGLNCEGSGENLTFPIAAPTMPWQSNEKIANEIHASPVAVIHTDKDGAWVINVLEKPGGGTIVAWLYRAAPGLWQDADTAKWMTASQALNRWLFPASTSAALTQRQLELTAAVTSRLIHDFGNYLTSILGFTELSLAQAPADSPQRQYLQEVLQSAQQGAAWIHRLQLFCRRNGTHFWPAKVLSVVSLEEARARLQSGSNLRWKIDVPANLPLVAIDGTALQMIVQELVKNVRDATKNGGAIQVTAREVDLSADEVHDLLGAPIPGRQIELTITDDGPGIPPADRARLFTDMFYSTKPRHRGVGLLVIYGILHRYHGGFRLEPAESGRGVHVRILLPIMPITGPTLGAEGKTPSVLLAHANPLICDSLRVMLESLGCQVTEAASPHIAIANCAMPKASFALVLIDLALAQMPGFELARRIMEHQAKANFIFLQTQPAFQSWSDEELLKRFELLRWPMQPATLLAAVHKNLARSPST